MKAVINMMLVTGALIITSATASADPDSDKASKLDTPQYTKCSDAAVTTADMQNCGDDEISRQNTVLNDLYKQTMQTLTEPQKQALRLNERAWIKRRDKTCAADEGVQAGGTMAPVEMDGCQIEQTELRILYLRRYKP